MRRKYPSKLYRERVGTIKALMPDACIGVDVIVGFPGETEAQFLETYNFLNELDISYLHVFTYSERPDTKAIDMKPVVPKEERKERNKMLRILSEKKKRAFYAQHAGTTRKVLFEAENDSGTMYGFTDNYIKVGVPYNEELVNTIQEVELLQVSASGYMKGWVGVLQNSYS